MKYKEAVRHLEELGLAVVMPDGKSHPTRKRLPPRDPVRKVPVRVLDQDGLPPELREMIRQSRAEINSTSKK